jgi:hypothetical protein
MIQKGGNIVTKYAKPRKSKALGKGWKPSESPLPPGIGSTDLERMTQRIEKILANNHIPDKPELALLEQVRLLCLRVIAYQNRDPILNDLNNQLSRHENVLHRYGFSEKGNIIPLNLLITRKVVSQEGGIEELLKKVEGKMAEFSK